jgi:membrane protease YdiL (CAAX protease family)
MQGFGNLVKHKWFPLLMTSIIFGSVHFGNPSFKIRDIVCVLYRYGVVPRDIDIDG